MSFQDVPFLPSRARFTPHFLKNVVEVKDSGTPHVTKLLLGVSKHMFPVKYFPPNILFLCQLNFNEITKMR